MVGIVYIGEWAGRILDSLCVFDAFKMTRGGSID